VAEQAKLKHPCLIILDVVETGGTLLEYVEKLNEVGITPHGDVLSAISKAGYKETRVGDFRVSSFAVREPQTPSEPCLQCELRLPFTSDDEESFNHLRAFDMWFMAEQVGWEAETDIPDNIGHGYDVVPKFTEMLNEYGDWIAYKMEKFYNQRNRPENIFVIHPDELGARAVSDKLRIRFNNQLSIVKVPRKAIKLAQSLNNSWEKAFLKIGKEEWVKQLESLSQASAIITDIFNASGSTYQALFQLLRYFNISVFCYFPFVDRDFGPGSAEKYGVFKLSLYQWYGPRQMKRKTEAHEVSKRRKSR
jgi:adenine/guanine phosphoribosyltransferase-like PRPP-binding protein